MTELKEYEKVKTKIYAVQWLRKLSELPAEILDNFSLSFDKNDYTLKIRFGTNDIFFDVNDYIAKDENGQWFKIHFKEFGDNYK